jgi:hypothetical protein
MIGTKHASNFRLIDLLTYLLTPCSTVLLEELTVLQLVKKFPAFYGIRMFITAFTSARHLSLSWDSSIQSKPPHTTSWRPALILSFHLPLGLPSGFFPSGFPIKTQYTTLPYWISNRGQLTRGVPPAWGLGEGLTTPYRENISLLRNIDCFNSFERSFRWTFLSIYTDWCLKLDNFVAFRCAYLNIRLFLVYLRKQT